MVKVGLIQTKVSKDIDANLEKTAKFISQAAKKGAKVVCLQELFATQYFAQTEEKKNFEMAEPIPGKTSKFLSEQAKKNSIHLIGGSFYEKSADGKYFNTTLIFDPMGNQISKYRKVHIPHDPNYYEQYYFSPGDLGYVNFTAGGMKSAPLICYDQWFPEPARLHALNGVQMIFYPTAIGWFPEMKKAEPFSAKRWENAMRGHASVNGIFTAGVNRVGKEGKMTFWGGSFIADPFGEVVARASSTKEEVLVAEIDLSLIEVSQDGWGFLRNRKPKTYGGLTK